MKHFISSLSVINANTPPCEGRVSSRKFLSLLLILFLGVTNAWAETASITFSEKGLTNGVQYKDPFDLDDNTTITFAGGDNDGKYYTTGTGIRTYANGTITVECTNGTISEISFTWSGTNKPTDDVANPTGYSTSTGKWTGSASSVTLTRPSGSGHWRLQGVSVTYEAAGSGETPDPTPSKLSTPANLKEASITETSATLSWDAVSNASNYSVTINGNNATATTNSYDATGLTAGTEYTWSVVAKGDGTNYTDSDAAQHTFTTTATTPDPEPGTGANVTYDFTKIDGFSSWGNSYSSHEVTYSDAKVTFEAASKQTSNITDCPVTKGKSVVLVMTDGSKLSSVKWVCKQWTTKTQTITLHYSTNGGGAYTSTGITSTNFSISSDNLPAGTNAVKITFSSTSNQVGISSCTITKVSSGSTEPTPSVSVAPTSHTFATTNVGETATQEFTITAENTTATLSASIDNTTDFAISAITGDKVTVTYQPQSAGDHTATMTVKAGEEASTTVALTGKAVAALEGTWILVTDASSLKAGDEIIIAAKDENYALSTTQNDNNRGQVEITKTDNTITATTEAQVLTLQAGNKENTLALYTGDGYLYAASSGSNWLRTETTLSDNSSWSIAVAADGTATLIAQGTNTRNTLYYNKNSKIFSCYSTTQQEIAIYKNTNGQQLAGLAYATTKYLTKLGDAFTTPTLTNPNSLTVTYSSSDNNVATVYNTGAVTIKAAGVVVITAAFAGDASYLEGSAKYTLCVTEHAGTEADSYSVADARRVIDVMETAEGVYATGIVSEIVTAYNSTYGNISYNISANGLTTSDQLQAYRGKSYDGANFTSADDVKVGDEVVVKGNLKKYNTTYEFDENNQLVSLNRTKEQAGLAYEETEHTANVGEDFTEPTLTNPNSLTVTYSSSNTALATVDATTGEVSILAAGKVTITASSAADATYAAGSAAYNITISDPSLAVATLPFYFDGKRADIEGTAGMTQSNLGTDYAAAPYLKFNAEGAWAIVQFDSEPGEFSFLLKQNGESIGTFTVYESENGEDYTPIWSGGDLGGNAKSATVEPTLSATARYVKFEYTTKPTGTNYGLGEISIKKADHRQEAGLVWNPATVSLTVDDAFTAPTLSNPNNLTGITFASDNTELVTVNAGVISLVSGKTGTATITATYAANEFYKAAEVTCVITVIPKSEKVVILAEYDGKWYALKGDKVDGKTIAALEVTYFDGKLYNVDDEAKALIEWERAVVDGNATFKNGENYLSAVNSADLTLSTNACDWVYEDGIYKIESSDRTFLYRATANGFKNYDKDNADTDDYSSLPVVTAPVYATGDIVYTRTATPGSFSTICLPYAGTISGATLFDLSDRDETYVYVVEAGTELEAGKPYVILPTANEIVVTCKNYDYVAAGSYKALYGTYDEMNSDELDGKYVITGNKYYYVHKVQSAGSKLLAYRAYFNLNELPTAPASAPGVRRIALGTNGQNTATGMENVDASAQPVKTIINGQLFILRGEKMYDAQGKLVK